MIRPGAAMLLALLVSHASASFAAAQQPAPAKPASTAPKADTTTLMMVEVTIARYLGDKRISSTPYSLTVVPHNRTSLRMGGDVPVPTTTFTPGGGDKPATTLASYSYRSVGTNIDVNADAHVDDKFILTIAIDESSIYPPESAPPTAKTTGAPAFRSFKSSNSMALRDGQSLEYVMATDRISGEVYRVNVKMTVVK